MIEWGIIKIMRVEEYKIESNIGVSKINFGVDIHDD